MLGLGVALFLLAAQGAALDIPELSRHVTDVAGALSTADRARIENRLSGYAQQTGHQFAVLIIPSLEGEVLEDYSIRVVERWKLGDAKRDDGLLVLVALKDRKIRIEVGHGLEGAVTDVAASRVIRETMAPKFAQNDLAGGLVEGLDRLMALARGESLGPAPKGTTEAPPTWAIGVIALVFLGLAVMLPRAGQGLVYGVIAGVVGFQQGGGWIAALIAAFIGFVVGALLPRRLFLSMVGMSGSSRSRGGDSVGGGGGSFGGGGSSGKW